MHEDDDTNPRRKHGKLALIALAAVLLIGWTSERGMGASVAHGAAEGAKKEAQAALQRANAAMRWMVTR